MSNRMLERAFSENPGVENSFFNKDKIPKDIIIFAESKRELLDQILGSYCKDNDILEFLSESNLGAMFEIIVFQQENYKDDPDKINTLDKLLVKKGLSNLYVRANKNLKSMYIGVMNHNFKNLTINNLSEKDIEKISQFIDNLNDNSAASIFLKNSKEDFLNSTLPLSELFNDCMKLI